MVFTGKNRHGFVCILVIAFLLGTLFVIGGCSGLPDNTGLEQTYALKDTSDTFLAQYVKKSAK